jgi:hypothetical protein
VPKTLENKVSYSGGEFSPLLDARTDHPKYTSACRQLQNMFALMQGGATRRPGFLFRAPAKYQTTDVYRYATRLMKFQFSPTTSFILEFGHKYVRFYSNRQQVVLSVAPLWVSGAHYYPGNFVQDPGDANNLYYCIEEVISPTQPHLAPNKWVKQAIYEVPSPYNGFTTGPSSAVYSLDVWNIIPCQINDVVYLVHPNYPPYKLVRLGDTNWTLTQVNFMTPALLDQNVTGVTLAGSATTGSITLNASASAWVTATYYRIGQSVAQAGLLYTCLIAHVSGTFATDLANGYWKLETIFFGGQIGGVFQLAQLRTLSYIEIALTAAGTSAVIADVTGTCSLDSYGTWSADVVLQRSDDGGVTWANDRTITSRSDHNASIPVVVPGSAKFRIVVSNYVSSTGTPRATFTLQNAFVYGLVQITAVNNAYSATAVVLTQLLATTPTVYWSEGAWSAARGYPRAVTAFQQRMVYGGTAYEPQRIWASQTNDLENFTLGAQTQATDSLVFDIAAIGRGRIEWLLGGLDLAVGFSGAEWFVNAGAPNYGGASVPVTPTEINASEHSAWGSCPGVPPALVGNAILYPQRSAKTIQQMLFSVYTNKYMSADLTSLSEHLFGAGAVQLDYQALFRNQGMFWVVTKSGSLCAMTYQLEQEVFAWSRHITGDITGGSKFMSVAVIDGQAADDDEVWVVVNRGNTNIELMNPVNWETALGGVRGVPGPNISLAIYVDAAITVTGPTTNIIGGLTHLIGKNVIGLLNGNITFGPLLVANDGTITIPNYVPAPPYDILQIGLPVYYAVQPMRLDVSPSAGILAGIFKALSRLYIRVFNSLSGSVADAAGKVTFIQYRPASTPLGQGPPLFTGDQVVEPFSTPGLDPTYVIQGSDPLPLTLLATTARLGVEGSA